MLTAQHIITVAATIGRSSLPIIVQLRSSSFMTLRTFTSVINGYAVTQANVSPNASFQAAPAQKTNGIVSSNEAVHQNRKPARYRASKIGGIMMVSECHIEKRHKIWSSGTAGIHLSVSAR